MKIFELLYKFFIFWTNIISKYERLKCNEATRNKSVALGVQSIIQSVLCGIFTVLSLLGLVWCINNFTGGGLMPIFTLIGAVAAAAAAIGFFVWGVIGGLVYMIYQFKLNKRAVRWVALVVWIAVIVAIVVFTVIIIKNF